MKKNRIRLSSGTEKLEARNLLSGSSISHWCHAPQGQTIASEFNDSTSTVATDGATIEDGSDTGTTSMESGSGDDGSNSAMSLSSVEGDYAETTSLQDGSVNSDDSSTAPTLPADEDLFFQQQTLDEGVVVVDDSSSDAAVADAVSDSASVTSSDKGAASGDASATDSSSDSESSGDLTTTTTQNDAEEVVYTATGGVADSGVDSQVNQGPIVINNYNVVGRGFGRFNRFGQGNHAGFGGHNGSNSQGTSQQFNVGSGITINNVNRIGGFGRLNGRFGRNFSSAANNEGNSAENGTSGDTSSSSAANSSGGITINNINRIGGFGRGGFGRGGFGQGNFAGGNIGGQFSGNFSGTFSGQFSGNQQSNQSSQFEGYNYLKGSGKKITYENPNAPKGSRKLDYNVITGTYKTHSPVALDLNGSGAIETTGASTAKIRQTGTAIGKTVLFDINGDGKNERIEWLRGNGDGLLVDDRDGRASKGINGNRLFGDANGQFSSGYEKLAQLDVDGNGSLSGAELSGLKVWQDNGDAKVQSHEMRSLADVGVDQISVQRNDVANARGETLMQSSAQRNGQNLLTEDVWFGQV